MSQSTFRAARPLGYGQFAAGAINAATLLSTITVGGVAGIPAGTTLAIITPEAQAVRWRDDSTAPTAAVGYPLAVGSELRYDAAGFRQLQFIAQTAGAVLNVAFFGEH